MSKRNVVEFDLGMVEVMHGALVAAIELVPTLGDRLNVRETLRAFEAGPAASFYAEKEKIIADFAMKDEAGRPVEKEGGSVDFGESEAEAMSAYRALCGTKAAMPRILKAQSIEQLPNEPRFEVLAELI